MSEFFTDYFDDTDPEPDETGPEEEQSPIVQSLSRLDLFSQLPHDSLLQLADSLNHIKLSAGEVFLRQYEELTTVFILADNAIVSVMNRYVDDHQRNGLFGARECINGEYELPYTATAVSNCDAWSIPSKDFIDTFKQISGLYEAMLETSIQDLTQELSVNEKETTHIQEQRRITQEILENMGVGTITINQAGEIGEYYNGLAKVYLGRESLAGLPFADVIFSGNKEALRNYYRALQLLFRGNQIDPEMIISLLPENVEVNQRNLQLSYSFAQDTDGNVSYVFVRIVDVTFEKNQEAKKIQEQKILFIMQANIGSYLSMLDSVKATLNLVKSLGSADIGADLVSEKEMVAAVMRSLHSAKGICGQHELIGLKTVIHELEGELQNINKTDSEFSKNSFLELISRFKEEYSYAVSLKNSLGPDIIALLQGINFSQDEFNTLLEAVKQENYDEIRRIVYEKILVRSDHIFDNWSQDIKKLAAQCGKEIEFITDFEADLRLHETLAHKLNIELGHLYRNCVDHGIESPEERRKLGKPELGKIAISASRIEEMLVIKISDDGAGLDEDKIVQMARENPNLPQQAVEEYIADNEIWRILFMPGFTSRDVVTSTSGRGVGLDAVWDTLKELKGKIRMDSEKGVGSLFTIEIPLSAGILV